LLLLFFVKRSHIFGGDTIWVRVCLTPHEAPFQLYRGSHICVVKTGIPGENHEYTAYH